jgi:L-amino acid N-acyltransferase YncA
MLEIRLMKPGDWPGIWRVIEPVFRKGETYPQSTTISESEARSAWVDAPAATFIAVGEGGEILGTYYLKANRPGQGSHVCNCGYMVAENARGRGVGSAMCVHSQHEALSRGFCAMQFNLVVSTNETAIHVYKKKGFETVGILPGAFCHPTLGYVDALVMYKQLGA